MVAQGPRWLPQILVGGAALLMLLAGGRSGLVRPFSALPLVAVTGILWLAAVSGRASLPRLDRVTRIAVWSFIALGGWVGLSLAWSILPHASWDRLNVVIVIVAALCLGLLVGVNATNLDSIARALGGALAVAIGWALAAVALPSFSPVGDRIARLSEPIGYWNALALMADMALAVGLWLFARRSVAERLGGTGLVFGAVVVVLMTQSRAGLATAVVIAVILLRRMHSPLERSVQAACAATPAVAVAGWAFTRDALSRDAAGRAAREADGKWFAIAVVFGLGCALVAAWRADVSRIAERNAANVRKGLAGLVLSVVAAGVVALVLSVGNPGSWAKGQLGVGACANNPNRVVSFCDNSRLAWWKDAIEIARNEPVIGTGAGTYGTARLPVRDDGIPVGEPHNVPLQMLSDLGLIGLSILLTAVVAAVIACRRALRRVERGERETALVLACFPLAFGLHSLVDYDFNFVAVGGLAALALGVLLGVGAEPIRVRSGPVLGPVVLAVLLFALGSVVLPDLARRAVVAVYAAEDIGVAAAEARRARSLNPFSIDAIAAQSFVAERAGSLERARELLAEGTRMQPANPDTWLALARFHYAQEPPQYCSAYEAFNEAWTLDRHSTRWVPGGPLDVSRAAVNDGACEER